MREVAQSANANTGAGRSSPRRSFSLFNTKAGSIDITFLILVLLLLSIGLVMLFSASFAFAYYNRGDSFAFISSQIVFAVAGVILMLMISTINYRILYKLSLPVYVATLVMLVAVFAFPPINGARRWIHLGFTNFQPSEIAKFAVVILFAWVIIRNFEKMNTFRYGILPFGILLMPIVVLMLLQPHLSGTILILGIGATMMVVGGSSLRWFGFMAAVALGILLALVLFTDFISYAEYRLIYWRDPFADPQGRGFQTIQSLLAIGSGGMMGVGIGNSMQKYLYLPEPQNDFIFAIVAEELGFVGATLIILLFALLVWRGFVIGMRCKDKFGSLVAIGLTTQVGLQAILNIMVVTNTVPNTGISLPFFSYGGTALIMLLCQMGVVLAISRQTPMEKN